LNISTPVTTVLRVGRKTHDLHLFADLALATLDAPRHPPSHGPESKNMSSIGIKNGLSSTRCGIGM